MRLKLRSREGFKYIDEGEGRPLLLLHGLFGALSNWDTVVDHFSSDFRVIVPQLPIYELPLLKSNLKSLVKFVVDFINFKELDKIHLIGNSLGGHVGLMTVLEYPERFRSLVLSGSSGLYENSLGNTYPHRKNYDFIKEKAQVTFYDPEMATKVLVDEMFGIVNDRNRVIRILAMSKSAIRNNLKEYLPYIHLPVSLIWGKNDIVTPPAVAEEFNSLIPHSELNWIEKCGHAPMMEHPDAFNQILEKFLKSTELKRYPIPDNAGQ